MVSSVILKLLHAYIIFPDNKHDYWNDIICSSMR